MPNAIGSSSGGHAAGGRLVGLDVARCIALIGMIAHHTLAKTIHGHVPWPQSLATGRSSGLFAVLAGTSIAIMTRRSTLERQSGRGRLEISIFVRALAIAAIGLVLEKLHDPGVGVILPYYGVLFMLGIPFLRLRARQLLAAALVADLVLPFVSALVRPHLPSTASVPLHDLTPFQLAVNLGLNGDFPALPWLGFLLAGMALGRVALDRPRTAWWLVATGSALAVAAATVSDLLLRIPSARTALLQSWPDARPGATWHDLAAALPAGFGGTTPTGSLWWLAVHAPHTATPFDLMQTTGCAVAVIGGCLLAARHRPRVWQVVFGAGAMSLTSYSLHLVLLRTDVWPDIGTTNFWSEAAVVLTVGAGFALLRWRGPLERIVSFLTGLASGFPHPQMSRIRSR
nr:heparan-alpha-glucosaminide N-acetyltransferase domain-containing protein [Pedococcus badiiscoriae]